MLSHQGKDITNFLTFRFDLDGVAHPALQWELCHIGWVSLVTTMTERDERM
jgi:hypothetical protein